MSLERKKIFKDTEQFISDWSKETYVVCPFCSKRAYVKNDNGVFNNYFIENTEMYCPNCGKRVLHKEMINYRLELRKNCSNCGKEIIRVIPNLSERKEHLTIKCENCGETETHKPRNIENRMFFTNQQGEKEKIFGLSLWLQEELKGDILWAYNYDHLKYLENYISSDLRVRIGMTLSAKLPQFIKDKKNRTRLLKLIGKMKIK